MSRDRQTAALRYLSHSANDIFWFVLPIVLPLLLVRFDLSYGEAGAILTFYLALNALGAFTVGRLSDSLPRRLVMGVGFWVAALGLIAAAFAPSFPLFMAFLAPTAIGVSTFHPTMYAHIEESVVEGKGHVLGIYEAFGTGAILVMSFVNGTLLASIGTRGVLIITAAPALVMGALLIRAHAFDAHEPQAEDVPQGLAAEHPPLALFILFLLTIVLRFTSVMGVLNFLPTIFTDYLGLPVDRAAYATALFFAGGIAGSLVASRFSRPALSYRVLLLGSLALAPVIVLLSTRAPLVVYMALVVLLGGVGSGLVVNQNLVLTRLGSMFGKGAAFGIMMGVVTLAQSVSPSLFGFAVDAWGFAAALMAFAAPVLVSTGLLALLSRRILSVVVPA